MEQRGTNFAHRKIIKLCQYLINKCCTSLIKQNVIYFHCFLIVRIISLLFILFTFPSFNFSLFSFLFQVICDVKGEDQLQNLERLIKDHMDGPVAGKVADNTSTDYFDPR